MSTYYIKTGNKPDSDGPVPFRNWGFNAKDHGVAIRRAVKEAIQRTIHVKADLHLRVTVAAGMTEETVFEADIPYSIYLGAAD